MDFTLDQLYRYLSPGYDSTGSTMNKLNKEDKFRQKVGRLLIDTRGKAMSWKEIKTSLESQLKGADDDDKKYIGRYFRFLGPSYDLGKIDALDSSDGYFDKKNRGTWSINPNLAAESPKKYVSVMCIRDQYVTPASEGCDKIGRFLNYTPSHVAAQMIPYLDVEFRHEATSSYTRTPSILRFLLGVEKDEKLSKSDRSLHDGSQVGVSDPKTAYTRSGMELFLMPQSLTNFDTLGVTSGGGKARLSPVKPSVPLASIEAFDITARNAGAKNFVHKTANLKLKIHDKSRMSEFAEFIRGGDGFRRVTIVTRYGWKATGSEDPFLKFINEEMFREDVWSIVNSQFSFDSTGQVNVGLQLVSAAARYLGSTNIAISASSKGLNELNETMRQISEAVDEIKFRANLPENVFIDQILKEATTTGFYSEKDVSKVDNAIKEFIAKLKRSSKFEDLGGGFFDKLQADLLSLSKGGAADKKKRSMYQIAQDSVKEEVARLFDKISEGSDPWLPKPGMNFRKALADEVAARKKGKRVVSLAKLFLWFANNMCEPNEELQFIFYPINENAGYAGKGEDGEAISLGEFPIDLDLLKAAYIARIRELNTMVLSIEEFFRIVIDQNFSDSRGIGYGKSSFYTQFSEEKPKEPAQLQKTSEASLKKWEKENPDFVVPLLEIEIKTEKAEVAGQVGDRIKRVYIYDRQSTPPKKDYSLMSVEEKKEDLQRGAPLLTIGSNGSLIFNSSVSSKTDGAQGAVYLSRSLQTQPHNPGASYDKSPTTDPENNLPMRTLPVQLTMTSFGCPIASLYQQYFVDFETGTALDNLYMCTQLQHNFNPGKFVTSWTFMQSNGYSKYVAPRISKDPATDPVKDDKGKTKSPDKIAGDKPPVQIQPEGVGIPLGYGIAGQGGPRR